MKPLLETQGRPLLPLSHRHSSKSKVFSLAPVVINNGIHVAAFAVLMSINLHLEASPSHFQGEGAFFGSSPSYAFEEPGEVGQEDLQLSEFCRDDPPESFQETCKCLGDKKRGMAGVAGLEPDIRFRAGS